MLHQDQNAQSVFRERRVHARRRLQSLTYVNVGDGRGVVSDISEGGLGVLASKIETNISTVAFRLPGSQDQLKLRGQIVWMSKSRREAGIRFLDPPETASSSIKKWISLESSQGVLQDESRIIRHQPPELSQSYYIREVSFDTAVNQVVRSWAEFHRQFPGHTLHGDPEWLEQRFQHEKEKVRVFLLQKGDQICGAVPLVLNNEQLVCKVGESALAKFPMRVLRLECYPVDMPEEEPAYDKLMAQIMQSDFDAMYIENLKTGSFLWNYLRSNALMRRGFRFYTKTEPLPHLSLRLDGTFDSYIRKFSAKTRKNRRYEIRTLRERGEVNLLRVTTASEIDAFLETAYEISKETWQFKRLGLGLATRLPEVVSRELRFLAERGWLRSYVLKCDGMPCSFILGHQYGSGFYAEAAGANDAWRSYSVGNIIFLLALEDLFKVNTPKFYDFGHTVAKFQEYKGYLATESYLEAKAWLFRRRAYPMLASSVYCACNAVSMNTGKLLDRFGLRSKVKQALWKSRDDPVSS